MAYKIKSLNKFLSGEDTNCLYLGVFQNVTQLNDSLTLLNSTKLNSYTTKDIYFSINQSGIFETTNYIGTYYNVSPGRASVLIFCAMNGKVIRGNYSNSTWSYNLVSMT